MTTRRQCQSARFHRDVSPGPPLGARRRALADAGSDLATFARARAASASASGGDGGAPSGTTSFGYQEVKAEEKEGLVAEVFERVAPSYDLMNDLMSGGIHRVWKDYLVSKVGVFPGMTHLDVAGGTGDVAFRVLRALRAEEAAARRAGRRRAAPGRRGSAR